MAMDDNRWKALTDREDRLSREATRLYRPSPLQLPFHYSMAPESILRGGKRSGKSVAAAMEYASRILGVPLTDREGNEIPLRHPVSTPDSPRQFWIIGWDVSHAATIHRLLFQPGMGGTFKAIKDLKTDQWRVWNRADPEDLERTLEAKLTEPLIPERFWKSNEDESFTWKEKKAYHFSSVELKNGAIVYYWPSSSKSPKQGEAVSGIWIDEDIQIPSHLKEWQDRLTDQVGWFMWSVWPHTRNNALIELLDRADKEEDEDPETRQIDSYQLIMSQNPFLEERGKQQSLSRMGSEDEIARRDRGELMLDMLSMYDYNVDWHLLKRPESDNESTGNPVKDAIQKLLRRTGKLPRECTRYLSVDPSHTRTACHSLCVFPTEWLGMNIGNLIVVEWELVVKKHSAIELAEALRDLMSGNNYEAFIMDQNFGRQTVGGRGKDENTFSVYEEAFQKKGLRSRQTISGFIPGCNVPSTRHSAVRRTLPVQEESGNPVLMLVENTTWDTQREFNTYRKKTENVGGEMLIYDQPANPRTHDCMASLEYGVTYIWSLMQSGNAYQDPSVYGGSGSPVYRRAMQIKRKQRQSEDSFVHMGPGSGESSI